MVCRLYSFYHNRQCKQTYKLLKIHLKFSNMGCLLFVYYLHMFISYRRNSDLETALFLGFFQ